MMRSMFASVSGLKAHQIKMDIIGNNIANVNTVGFKGSRVSFSEVFSQTISGAGAPDSNNGSGGTNPIQIGLGLSLSSVDMDTSRGSLQRTDSPTDLSIEGEGFFVVRKGNEGTPNFTRAGNFTVDKLGNLVTPSGMNVLGWQKYEKDSSGNVVFDLQEEVKPLNIFEDEYNLNKRIIAAQSTTKAVLAGNLDATETACNGTALGTINDTGPADGIPDDGTTNYDPQFIVPITVYDNLGNSYKININFWKNFVDATPETSWYFTVTPKENATASSGASGFIKFDSNGEIVDATGFETKKDVQITPDSSVGAAPFTFQLDFEKLSMYANDSSVKPTRVDGYPPGSLVTFSIGSDGIITGVYSNGRQQPLGLIGLAVFDNPAGLQRVGNNMFIPTTNSGEFQRAIKPGDGDAGTLNPGTLEMSNIDLAKQFTEMIVTQRGFQANARVMTTSDEILQELANMKR